MYARVGQVNNTLLTESIMSDPILDNTPDAPRRHTVFGYSISVEYLNDPTIREGDRIALIPDNQLGYREYVVVVKNNVKRLRLYYDNEFGIVRKDD